MECNHKKHKIYSIPFGHTHKILCSNCDYDFKEKDFEKKKDTFK